MMKRRVIRFSACLILLAATATAAPKDNPWPGLDLNPGPYAAGFRIIQSYDQTRTFRTPFSPSGRRIAAETARPMQICIWYPANPPNEASPMRLADYLHLQAQETDFDPILPEERRQSEEALHSQLERITGQQISTQRMQAILAQSGIAFLNAPPLEGSLPVILAIQRPSDNWIFFEYLASHGYLVATVPPKDRMSRQSLEFTPNPEATEIRINDLEFLYGQLRSLPMADLDRSALWAFSSGSVYTLLYQMRNLSVRAMVHMEGWEGFLRGRQILTEAPFYDPAAVRVPYLMIGKQSEERNPSYRRDREIFQSLQFADRTWVRFAAARHADFVSRLPAEGASTEGSPPWIFAQSSRLARLFLDAHLKGETSPWEGRLQSLSESAHVELERVPALPAAPSEAEFVQLIEQEGVEQATQLFQSIRRTLPDHLPFRERTLNRFGYFLLGSGRLQEAIGLFRLNTHAYPSSANVWDSLGEALLQSGDSQQAAIYYNKVLQIDPQNEHARTQLDEILGEDRSPWRLVDDQGPPSRFAHAMAYDTRRNRLVLFGGALGNHRQAGDTWEWDGVLWHEIDTSDSPTPQPRYGHQMAYHQPSGQLLLFGGATHARDNQESQWFPETWSWDGQRWTILTAQGPSPRRSPALSYHPQRRTVVLFGGLGPAGFLNDTWEWDGTHWTQLDIPGPAPRYGSTLAPDPSSGGLLLYGGRDHDGNWYTDSWLLKDGQWKELEVEQGPSASVGQVMASDTQTGSVLLAGGIKRREHYSESWLWERSRWRHFESNLPYGSGFPAMTFDAHRRQFILVARREGGEQCESWVLDSALTSR